MKTNTAGAGRVAIKITAVAEAVEEEGGGVGALVAAVPVVAPKARG
jgi:hypothetical protein